MSLNLIDLEEDHVRDLMLEEFESEIKEKKLYISSLLKPGNRDKYIYLFSEAIIKGNEGALARTILINGLLKDKIPKKDSSGRVRMIKTPKDFHISLAEHEFNRFYIKGVCRAAISQGKSVEVYSAKEVRDIRPEFQSAIGNVLEPQKLLKDLKENKGIHEVLKMRAESDSVLSVRISD